MSDAPVTPPEAPAAGKGKRSALRERIGPFELRVWIGLVALGLVLGMALRRRLAVSGDATVVDPANQPQAAGADFVTVGASPLNGGGGYAPTTPETLQQWLVRAAQAVAQSGAGYDAATVDTALRKYVNGQPVTATERAIIALALRLAGTPPDDVPAIEDAEPSPTTNVPQVTPTQPAPPPTSTPVVPAQPDDPGVRWARATELKRLMNESVHGGRPMTDAELREAATYFTTGDPTIDPTFRFYWRFWLDQHGYAGQRL